MLINAQSREEMRIAVLDDATLENYQVEVAESGLSRGNIYLRDQNRCQYCGRRFPSSELSLDHVVPVSRGGKSHWENVVCACLPCNVKKGNKLLTECHMQLIRQPHRPRWHPLHRLHGRQYPDIWKNFLDEAYWNVELRVD